MPPWRAAAASTPEGRPWNTSSLAVDRRLLVGGPGAGAGAHRAGHRHRHRRRAAQAAARGDLGLELDVQRGRVGAQAREQAPQRLAHRRGVRPARTSSCQPGARARPWPGRTRARTPSGRPAAMAGCPNTTACSPSRITLACPKPMVSSPAWLAGWPCARPGVVMAAAVPATSRSSPVITRGARRSSAARRTPASTQAVRMPSMTPRQVGERAVDAAARGPPAAPAGPRPATCAPSASARAASSPLRTPPEAITSAFRPSWRQPARPRPRWGCPSPRTRARARPPRRSDRCDSTAIQEVPPAPDTSMAPTPAASRVRATAGRDATAGLLDQHRAAQLAAQAQHGVGGPAEVAVALGLGHLLPRVEVHAQGIGAHPVHHLAHLGHAHLPQLHHPEVGQQEHRRRRRADLVGVGQLGPHEHRPLAAEAERQAQPLGRRRQIAVDARGLLGAAGHPGHHQRRRDGPAEQGGARGRSRSAASSGSELCRMCTCSSSDERWNAPRPSAAMARWSALRCRMSSSDMETSMYRICARSHAGGGQRPRSMRPSDPDHRHHRRHDPARTAGAGRTPAPRRWRRPTARPTWTWARWAGSPGGAGAAPRPPARSAPPPHQPRRQPGGAGGAGRPRRAGAGAPPAPEGRAAAAGADGAARLHQLLRHHHLRRPAGPRHPWFRSPAAAAADRGGPPRAAAACRCTTRGSTSSCAGRAWTPGPRWPSVAPSPTAWA